MKMRVAEAEQFVRDSNNLAIVNTDKNAISFHEQKMKRLNKEKNHEVEINNIKAEISEIKNMLSQLLSHTQR